MRFTILAATLLMASLSQAESIKCYFTEPFMTTTYNKESKQLVVSTIDKESALVINAELTETGPDSSVVVANHNVLLSLIADGNGNNGMGDKMYPISAVVDLEELGSLEPQYGNINYGGCEVTN